MTRSRDTSKIGQNAKQKGKETFYVGAKLWRQPNTDGAPNTQYTNGAVAVDAIQFANGSTRTAFVTYALPKSYDGGMLSYKLFYYGVQTTSGQNLQVRWQMESANIRSDDDTVNGTDGSLAVQDHTNSAQTNGTTGTINHTLTALYSSVGVLGLHLQTTPFVDFQPNRTWAEGVTLCSFKLSRIGAADSYGGSVNLIGAQFQYTTDLANDN